jgi:hypothetical protein
MSGTWGAGGRLPGITMTNDAWGLSGSLTTAWGGNATEAGASEFLWQLDVELKLFY